MPLTPDQFERLFTNFTTSATRIETLPTYTVDSEREELAHYLAGHPIPAERNKPWADNIRRATTNGKYMGRVHVLDDTLTSYLQFEIDWYYTVNAAAGEDIRFIRRRDVPDIPYADTWIFDDALVVDLAYNQRGQLLQAEQSTDPHRLRQARTAWTELQARSFPLTELLATLRRSDRALP